MDLFTLTALSMMKSGDTNKPHSTPSVMFNV